MIDRFIKNLSVVIGASLRQELITKSRFERQIFIIIRKIANYKIVVFEGLALELILDLFIELFLFISRDDLTKGDNSLRFSKNLTHPCS